jgi:butyryl-CoA dehydrogenase
MLLFQRAVMDGSLSLLMQCSKYIDMQHVCAEEEKEKYHLLLEILTPVAKTYPSEMGILSISQGLQCFGGSGYCDDYPLEQYYRDARIHPIHEGTTGIQGIDLLGRKVRMEGGKALALFLEEAQKTIEAAGALTELRSFAEAMTDSLDHLKEVTGHLMTVAKEESPEFFLADATLYLEYFGIISIAWQWLLQGVVAQTELNENPPGPEEEFFKGKLYTMRYFFAYELPKIKGLAERLMNTDGLTVEIGTNHFND